MIPGGRQVSRSQRRHHLSYHRANVRSPLSAITLRSVVSPLLLIESTEIKAANLLRTVHFPSQTS